MKEFLIGVNYWASHAGVDMWRDWKADIVNNDLKLLVENGVKVLRVFPNWRDFQPVKPAFGGGHSLREYRMNDDTYATNPYYLDDVMLERFALFCEMAQKHGLKLIVGLITGWMSGRLFVPSALYEKNIFTDPTALYFQQLFIKGFVERMKSFDSIYAWDLGNECNCMDYANSKQEAYNWTSIIVNAIKACDSSRPVVSGMHSLELNGVWNIQDQGELTDILTTHPYPFWIEHSQLTPLNSFRTLLHATAQSQYYESIGQKPCLVEELGSMGPMNCDEEIAAGFLKANLWSNWAHGAPGVLWWCAFDQSLLTAPPYDWNMCERELGVMDIHQNPKPTLLQIKDFQKQLHNLQLDLPKRNTDAVCIMSWGQDHWGISFMTYLLAKQAGLTLDFTYCNQELPESNLYFMPSVHMDVMSKKSYDTLKQRIKDGATLYISVRDGIFTEFEEFTGFHVQTATKISKEGTVYWNEKELSYRKPHKYLLRSEGATVLQNDEDGNPLFGVHSYGKGKVYFLNFPMEEMLLTDENGFNQEYYRIYEEVASAVLEQRDVHKENPYIGMTIHKGKEAEYIVLINYTDQEQDADLIIKQDNLKMEICYGDPKKLQPYDAAILKFMIESK